MNLKIWFGNDPEARVRILAKLLILGYNHPALRKVIKDFVSQYVCAYCCYKKEVYYHMASRNDFDSYKDYGNEISESDLDLRLATRSPQKLKLLITIFENYLRNFQ